MLITKIQRQSKNTHRASIYLDGEFAVGVREETIVKFGLRKGVAINRITLDNLRQAEVFLKAKEKALRLLSYRARSVKEIRDRLKKASFQASVIDEVIAGLRRSGLLDDAVFARMFADDTLARKPIGKMLLHQQLRRRGVASQIVEKLIEELYSPDTEERFALSLAKRRLDRTFRSQRARNVPDLVKQKKRLSDYLVRRGFDWDTVTYVVSKLLPNQP